LALEQFSVLREEGIRLDPHRSSELNPDQNQVKTPAFQKPKDGAPEVQQQSRGNPPPSV
jgi:hypothetical protein